MAYVQVANSRGGKALIFEDYRYLRNKTRADKIYWRCANRACGVYLTTNAFDVDSEEPEIVIHHRPGQHRHAAEAELVATTALIEQMLREVAADPSLPSKRVYDQVMTMPNELGLYANECCWWWRLQRKHGASLLSTCIHHL